jgi:hypothetical protein
VLSATRATGAHARDGAIWAGTYGKGLWRIKGDEQRLYTTADGLSSDQIRSLYQDPDGTLWIATFGGGLNALRDGKFSHFMAKDGLLSDNVAKVFDDGESLWLEPPRTPDAKRQLLEFSQHRRPPSVRKLVWKTVCAVRSARRVPRGWRDSPYRRPRPGLLPAAAWRF